MKREILVRGIPKCYICGESCSEWRLIVRRDERNSLLRFYICFDCQSGQADMVNALLDVLSRETVRVYGCCCQCQSIVDVNTGSIRNALFTCRECNA